MEASVAGVVAPSTSLWQRFFAEDLLLLEKLFLIWDRFPLQNLKTAWDTWKVYLKMIAEERKRRHHAQLSKEVIYVFKTSTRFKRTSMEKNTIRKYLLNFTSCIPIKLMTKQEVDILCNEIGTHTKLQLSLFYVSVKKHIIIQTY